MNNFKPGSVCFKHQKSGKTTGVERANNAIHRGNQHQRKSAVSLICNTNPLKGNFKTSKINESTESL